MRIVLDTNVFMSGLFWSGPPYEILKAWQARRINLIVSEEILFEYNRVSEILCEKYPHLELKPFLELLTMYAEVHEPISLDQPISRDPDDDKFITCALAARVTCIVSGDKDLLSISGYQNIQIMTPVLFINEHLKP